MSALIRALSAASHFVGDPDNLGAVSEAVAKRIGVDADLVVRSLTGNLKISPEGAIRADNRYMMIGGDGVNRPDPVQAAWLYAQIVRWGQAVLTDELRAIAQSVFRPDLYDAALGLAPPPDNGEPYDGIGAFIGPRFDASAIASHLEAWRIRRPGRPHLSLVH